MRRGFSFILMLVMMMAAAGGLGEGAQPHLFMEIPYGTPGEECARLIGERTGVTPERHERFGGGKGHDLRFPEGETVDVFGHPARIDAFIGRDGLKEISCVHEGMQRSVAAGDDAGLRAAVAEAVTIFAQIMDRLLADFGTPTHAYLATDSAAYDAERVYHFPMRGGRVQTATLEKAFAAHEVVTAKAVFGNVVCSLDLDALRDGSHQLTPHLVYLQPQENLVLNPGPAVSHGDFM